MFVNRLGNTKLLDLVLFSAITSDLVSRLGFSNFDISILIRFSSLLNRTLLFIKLEIILLFPEFYLLKYSIWSSRDFVSSLLFSQSLKDCSLANFWFCLINKNCSKMNDFIAVTSRPKFMQLRSKIQNFIRGLCSQRDILC